MTGHAVCLIFIHPANGTGHGQFGVGENKVKLQIKNEIKIKHLVHKRILFWHEHWPMTLWTRSLFQNAHTICACAHRSFPQKWRKMMLYILLDISSQKKTFLFPHMLLDHLLILQICNPKCTELKQILSIARCTWTWWTPRKMVWKKGSITIFKVAVCQSSS